MKNIVIKALKKENRLDKNWSYFLDKIIENEIQIGWTYFSYLDEYHARIIIRIDKERHFIYCYLPCGDWIGVIIGKEFFCDAETYEEGLKQAIHKICSIAREVY